MKREVGIAFILFGRAQGTNYSLYCHIIFFLIERTKGDHTTSPAAHTTTVATL